MLTTRGSGGSVKVNTHEHSRYIVYELVVGRVVRLRGEVRKDYPGWKRVWSETLAILLEVAGELEEGTGVRSRAFQRSPSTMVDT
jgi:hypothetical protein